MRRPVLTAVLGLLVFALAGPALALGTTSSVGRLPRSVAPGAPATVTLGRPFDTRGLVPTPACEDVPATVVSACNLIKYVSTRSAKVPYSPIYNGGLTPQDLRQAYGLPPTRGVPGSGPTVAVVVGFESPTLEANLAEYRSTFGLGDCTVANGCLSFVDHHPSDPTYEVGATEPIWLDESALDVQAVSAACPACKIMVSRSFSDQYWDFDQAVADATRAGAKYISMSYTQEGEIPAGSPKDPSIPPGVIQDDPGRVPVFYNAPGVSYFAASGDSQDSPNQEGMPQTAPTVLSVGGTTVEKDVAGKWVHSVWNASAATCSRSFAAPKYQAGARTGCKGRATTDLSAVSSNFAYRAPEGWATVGGTSVSAPFIAGLAASMGVKGLRPATLYAASGLADITTGNNYSCSVRSQCVPQATSAGIVTLPATYTCSQGPTQFCLARKGWDGPSGLGTPLKGKFYLR